MESVRRGGSGVGRGGTEALVSGAFLDRNPTRCTGTGTASNQKLSKTAQKNPLTLPPLCNHGKFSRFRQQEGAVFPAGCQAFAPDPTQTGSGGGYTGLKNMTTKYSK